MRQKFPALNGPFADHSREDSKVTDYRIGRSFIYACFAWSEATTAHKVAFGLAKKHSVGFFNVSGKDGEVWAPRESEYSCIHGTGAAFASNPEVRIITVSRAVQIRSKPSKH
jgi:hypothetical protein